MNKFLDIFSGMKACLRLQVSYRLIKTKKDIGEIEKKSKNTVKRTLGLRTTHYVCVFASVFSFLCSVSLFNGISAFVDYLMPKSSF